MLAYSIWKIRCYSNIELAFFLDYVNPPLIHKASSQLPVVGKRAMEIKSPSAERGSLFPWLPGPYDCKNYLSSLLLKRFKKVTASSSPTLFSDKIKDRSPTFCGRFFAVKLR